ncbi:hypothetical protein HDV06_003653 [Boothiomyces sp. JEL0866]|nr:hypothetical protein HDV06_003653 [Boothiomyces sp. JEL0866]
MSGFRDFNQAPLGKQVKTLGNSLDEDDWETDDTPVGDTTPSEALQVKRPSTASNRNSTHQESRASVTNSPFLQSTINPNNYQQESRTSVSNSPFLQSGVNSNDFQQENRTSVSNSPFLQGVNANNYQQPQRPSQTERPNNMQKMTPVVPELPRTTPILQNNTPSYSAGFTQPTSAPKPAVYQPPVQKPAIPQQETIPTRASVTKPNIQHANLPTSIPVSLSKPLDTFESDQNYKNNMGINTVSLASKYPYFTASEIAAFHQQFAASDKDKSADRIHPTELSAIATKAGESAQAVIAKIAQLSLANDAGLVSFEGFLTAVSGVRKEKGASYVGQRDDKKIVLHGHMENTTHTINEDEKESFTIHINQQLGSDKLLASRLPIDPKSMQIFSECKDGLLLAKLINDSVPGTIDERVLNVNKKLNAFQMTENNNVVVNSAKAIGCSVVNIGANDLIEGREHLILGLIWQIIKIGLQANIDIKVHPELFRLLLNGENLEDFLKLPVEQILLRWFNYHLGKAGHKRTVKNFGSDVKDGENYTILLNQLAPAQCSKAPLQTSDLMQRAEQILQNADKIGCRKYLSPKTLVEGNQKLNFAFVAHLFNTHPGLEKLSEAEMAGLDSALFDSEGDREARAFALWLNSLGVDPFVNNLFDDLTDGLILLQAIDKVKPEFVDWKKVNKPAPITSKFKKVENCNYVTVLGKALKFSLVGIGGSDIVDGNKKLTLALVWQLMREHIIQTLKSLSQGGVEITDNDMISWANQAVKNNGKQSTMNNFKDPSLKNAVFFLDLLNAIKPGIVNYELVSKGETEELAKLNAKYAISIARKLGATIFVLPEDIVEVKPKMILTFVGTLMALSKSLK